jgi:hypothetical protein
MVSNKWCTVQLLGHLYDILGTIRIYIYYPMYMKSIQIITSSFSPYCVQEIDGTVSSLLDTMGIAWRASLSMQLWCQGLRPYQSCES